MKGTVTNKVRPFELAGGGVWWPSKRFSHACTQSGSEWASCTKRISAFPVLSFPIRAINVLLFNQIIHKLSYICNSQITKQKLTLYQTLRQFYGFRSVADVMRIKVTWTLHLRAKGPPNLTTKFVRITWAAYYTHTDVWAKVFVFLKNQINSFQTTTLVKHFNVHSVSLSGLGPESLHFFSFFVLFFFTIVFI